MDMPTTIQVNEDTIRLLNELKRRIKAKSHDEVIKTLLKDRAKLPDSIYGLAKGSRPYRHDMEQEHDLQLRD